MVTYPSDWEEYTIDEITRYIITGGTPSTKHKEYWGGNIPWLASAEIHQRRISSPTAYITEMGFNNSSAKIAPAGSTLIALAGQGKTRGTAAYLTKPMSLNQSLAAIVTNEKCNSEFIFFVLEGMYDFLRKTSSGDGGRGGLSKKLLKKIRLTIPSLIEEQRAIAAVISSFDTHIDNIEALIEKKKAIRDGALEDLMSGRTRLDGFSGEWKERYVNELGNFISGSGFPLKFQGNVSEKYPFYKVSDFNREDNTPVMKTANNYVSEKTAEKMHCSIIPPESIVFAKIGAAIYLERKRLTQTDCCIDNNMMALCVGDNNDPRYVCYALQRIKFGEYVRVTALPSLSAKILGKIKILMTNDVNEQKAIADILTLMDNEIHNLMVERDKMIQIKEGAMDDLLTGRVRLSL